MTKITDIPAIRFKGFSDTWEQRKLGDVVDVRSGKDYKHLSEGNIPVYGTGGFMLNVNQALSYDEDAIGIGRKGTIDKPYILKAPFWTVDTLFYAIPREKVDLNFAFDVFQNIDWKKKDESTGVPSLSKTAINEIDVLVPQYDEQQPLGQFFNRIDNLITLHQRKYDKLTNVKKSMLEKMFPQNGSNVPEIRFKGFTEAWEQRKVSELFKVTRGYVLAATLTEPAKTDEMPYPVYSSQTKDNGLMGYYKDYLYEDAITWTTDGANAGTVNYRAGKFYCTNVCGVLLSNEVTANQMIAEALNNVAKGYVSYVGNPKLMNNVMADIEIMIPTHAEEREKLSVFFRNLDNLITLHQCKCQIDGCRFQSPLAITWEQRKLGEVGETYTGLSGKSKDDFGHGSGKFITYMNVFSNPVASSNMTEAIEIDDSQNKVQFGDVLFTTSSETPDEVGMSSVWLENAENTYLNSFCFGYRPTTEYNPYYLAYMLRSSSMRKKITFLAQGISRYNISKNKMMDIEMPIPSIDEQKQIGEYFRNLDNLITLHQCE